MAANRTPFAPPALLGLSKATLADLVWELAAHACPTSCDSIPEKWTAILEGARSTRAPRGDLNTITNAAHAVGGR